MPDEIVGILKLLATLSALKISFDIKEGDTVVLTGLDDKTRAVLHAVLASKPDEFSEEEEGYRLWWD